MNVNMMSYDAKSVKSDVPKSRSIRHDLTIDEIQPCFRAMVWHIDKQLKGKTPVCPSVEGGAHWLTSCG